MKLENLIRWMLRQPAKSLLQVESYFDFEFCEADGTVFRKERAPLNFHRDGNGIVTVGVNDMLNAYFGATTQSTAWYVGLVDNSSFSAFSSADTMGSHSGWIENTAYNESTRPQWSAGTAASGAITNSGTFQFTINSSVTIHGAFVTNNSTKSGTSGTLWATGALASNQSLTSGQLLKLAYTVTLTPTN